MPENSARPTANELLVANLLSLIGPFNGASIDRRVPVDLLWEAVDALRAAEEKNQGLQHAANTNESAMGIQTEALNDALIENMDLRDQVDALERALGIRNNPKAEGLTVLISSSGGMHAPIPAERKTILEIAIEATLSLAKSYANVNTAFYGNGIDPIRLEGADTAKLIRNLPDGGSYYHDILLHMRMSAERSDKPQHFAIVNDGTLVAMDVDVFATLNILRDNPGTTVDFVVIGDNRYDAAVAVARFLNSELPDQVFLHTPNGQDGNVRQTLKAIAAYNSVPMKQQQVQPGHRPSNIASAARWM